MCTKFIYSIPLHDALHDVVLLGAQSVIPVGVMELTCWELCGVVESVLTLSIVD